MGGLRRRPSRERRRRAASHSERLAGVRREGEVAVVTNEAYSGRDLGVPIRVNGVSLAAGPVPPMLTIHEWTRDDGASETVRLGEQGGAVVLSVGSAPAVALPMLALERVMERYGRPLAEGVALDGPKIDLGGGRTLQRIRHLERYDVIARDFLVWCAPGREPLVELAVTVSGALEHLARVAGERVEDDVART